LTNIEIYELSVRNEFLPKHAKIALENLVKNNRVQEINNSLIYKISYSNYKEKIVTSKFIKI
jgi:hypothetical protein